MSRWPRTSPRARRRPTTLRASTSRRANPPETWREEHVIMTEMKPRVLFVCTHNAARSQMAEALLRHYAGERFEVLSAGATPTEVHPLTRQVLTDIDLDPSGLYA